MPAARGTAMVLAVTLWTIAWVTAARQLDMSFPKASTAGRRYCDTRLYIPRARVALAGPSALALATGTSAAQVMAPPDG